MRVRFSIPVKPFSINTMYYGDGRNKTTAARNWTHEVFHHLNTQDIQDKLKTMRDSFDPLTQCYIIRLRAYYPEEIMYKQDGAMSAKAHDVTNWEKPLVDLIFLPKYNHKNSPNGVQNLGIDDKYLKRMNSGKEASKDGKHHIDISIAITPI